MLTSPAGQDRLEPIKKLWRVHKPLTVSAIYTAVLFIFFMVGIFADGRIISGVPAWLKPAKFAVSIVIYSITILWLLSFVDTSLRWRKPLVRLLGWTVILTFAAEWFAIITQAIRGTTSHFNVTTTFDAALWSIMGTAIIILWVANFMLAILLLLQRFENPALAWGLRLGLIITIIGMGLGYLMTDPTPEQLEGFQAGNPVNIIGAHSVGVPDGGKGLPITNWSTEGGDLRIGHFVGMHALQVIPLFAFYLMRRRRLSQRQQTQLVWTGSAIYLGLTLLVTWQALRAQSIIAPDALTMTTFAAIVGAGVILSLLIVIRKPRHSNKLAAAN